MSYSEAVTRNDLTEILTQLGIGVSFGQMYHADWTATSSSSTPYQVTGSITLSKGKYLAIISIPVCSQETMLYFYLHSLGAQKSIVHGFSQGKHPVLFELTETTTIWVETGMSQSTTYSYLERGGLDVICLSDLKQYGTTVLDYYPVGSYYETSDANFNPNTTWGGTWELTKGGIVKGEPLITRNEISTSTEITTTGTTGTNILSFQHTSNTGKIWIYGAATIKTNANTSSINIDANGQMAFGRAITNIKDYHRLSAISQRSGMPIGTPFTVALRMASQNANTTASCAPYSTIQLFVMDVPLLMGRCWHRTA